MQWSRRNIRLLLVLGAGIIGIQTAPSAMADISHVIFHVEASNASGSGTFDATSDQLAYNPGTGVYTWVLPAPVDITNGSGMTIALLQSANAAFVDQPARRPRINLAWSAVAGDEDTTITIRSALVSYPAISDASGKGTVSLSVTDQNGDGARLSSLDPEHGLGIFTADYNGLVPNGTQFTNLLSLLTADPGGTQSMALNDPPTGFRPIGVPVADMSTQAVFMLTADDLTSGNTGFVIMPEPACVVLLALVGLGLRRR